MGASGANENVFNNIDECAERTSWADRAQRTWASTTQAPGSAIYRSGLWSTSLLEAVESALGSSARRAGTNQLRRPLHDGRPAVAWSSNVHDLHLLGHVDIQNL